MRLSKLTVVTAFVSCGLTLAVLHRLQIRQEGRYAQLSARNDRMRYQVYQHYRQAQTARAASESPAQVEQSPVPATTLSTGTQYGYHNAGFRTPGDSMQTLAWACDRGNVQAVAGMITMTASDYKQAADFLAQQPAEVRAKWGSVENFAANLLVLSSLASSFPSSDVIAASPVEMHGKDLAVWGEGRKFTLRKVGDGWKVELTAMQVETLYRQIARAVTAIQSH